MKLQFAVLFCISLSHADKFVGVSADSIFYFDEQYTFKIEIFSNICTTQNRCTVEWGMGEFGDLTGKSFTTNGQPGIPISAICTFKKTDFFYPGGVQSDSTRALIYLYQDYKRASTIGYIRLATKKSTSLGKSNLRTLFFPKTRSKFLLNGRTSKGTGFSK